MNTQPPPNEHPIGPLLRRAEGPNPPRPHALANSIEGCVQELMMDLDLGKLSPTKDLDFFYEIGVIEKLRGRPNLELRTTHYFILLGSRKDASPALRKKWFRALLATLRLRLRGRPLDSDALPGMASYLEIVYKERPSSRTLQDHLSFLEKTAERLEGKFFWDAGIRSLFSYLTRGPSTHRKIAARGAEALLDVARRLYEAGRLTPLTMAAAFTDRLRGEDAEKIRWPAALRPAYVFWLEETLKSRGPEPDVMGDIFNKASQCLGDARYLEKAVAFYTDYWRHRSAGALLYVIETKTRLVRRYPIGSEPFRRHFDELKSMVETTVSRHSDSYGIMADASGFMRDYLKVMATPRTLPGLALLLRRWSRTAEKLGEGYHAAPYFHLCLADVALGSLAEAEGWILRCFLRFNILMEKEFAELSAEPAIRKLPKSSAIRRTISKISAFYKSRVLDFYDTSIPFADLQQDDVAGLRRRFKDFLSHRPKTPAPPTRRSRDMSWNL